MGFGRAAKGVSPKRQALRLDAPSSMLGFDDDNDNSRSLSSLPLGYLEVEQEEEDLECTSTEYEHWKTIPTTSSPPRLPQRPSPTHRVKSHTLPSSPPRSSLCETAMDHAQSCYSLWSGPSRRGRRLLGGAILFVTALCLGWLSNEYQSLLLDRKLFLMKSTTLTTNSAESAKVPLTEKIRTPQSSPPSNVTLYSAMASTTTTSSSSTSTIRDDYSHCAHLRPNITINNTESRLSLGNNLLFLHMGKAGGGAVNVRLRNEWNVTYSYCHPSPKRCHDDSDLQPKPITIPDWIQQHRDGLVIMNLRDPIDRFVSAYYWRRLITCRPNQIEFGSHQESRSPHKSGYLVANDPDTYCRRGTPEDWHILFGSRYNQSANGLAKALCSEDATVAEQAARDMQTIVHANVGIVDWLGEYGLQTLLSNHSLLPVVQESGYDLLAQVDDAINHAFSLTQFESADGFVNRQAQVQYRNCVNGGSNATRQTSSKKPLSNAGSACLSQFYQREYNVLERVKEEACSSDTCRKALDSILSRRPLPANADAPTQFTGPVATSDTANTTLGVEPKIHQAIELDKECRPLPMHERQRLEFVHIPKTGGSSVEAVALLHNISWSTCHWLPRILTIPDIPDCPAHPVRDLVHHPKYEMSYWHLPPHLIDDGSFSPYEGAQLFAVVRNPYSRLISEWNYLPGLDRNNASALNAWVQGYLSQMLQKPNEPFVAEDGHFLQQHLYFQSGQSVIVLRQERLKEDFDCLMRMYGYNMTLPSKRLNPNKGGALTARNFTKATVEMIQRVYAKDFKMFGYPPRYGDMPIWRAGRWRRR